MTALVDGRHVGAHTTELFLELRAAPLGVEDVRRMRVIARLEQLQRDAAARARVGGQEHDAHAPVSDAPLDLVRPELSEAGAHPRPRWPRAPAGTAGPAAGTSGNQLPFERAARAASLKPLKTSPLTPSKTLPTKSASLGCSISSA